MGNRIGYENLSDQTENLSQRQKSVHSDRRDETQQSPTAYLGKEIGSCRAVFSPDKVHKRSSANEFIQITLNAFRNILHVMFQYAHMCLFSVIICSVAFSNTFSRTS